MEQKYFESLYPSDVRLLEIEQILTLVKGGSSCQLVSLPGVGRANLLGFLAYNKNIRLKHLGEKQKKYHFVMVHFAEVRKRPLFDVTKFMFLSLIDSLRERGMNEEYSRVNTIFRESLVFQDELVLFQGMKRAVDFLAVERGLTIVLLLDRFEEYIPSVTVEFFSNLRVLRNRAKYHFSVVFSLHRQLEDMLDPTLFADFYELIAGHVVYLCLFDKPSVDFRISYLEKMTGNKLPVDIRNDVIHLTGGHGKLTRLSVETLLASSHEFLASSLDLEEFLMSQKTLRGALFEIWNSLMPAEQKELISYCHSEAEGRRIISDRSFANTQAVRGSESPQARRDDKTSASYLQSVGLAMDGKITIPLLTSFIATTIAEEKNPGKIIYDEKTNTIKHGDVAISDVLTAAEFRLLRFLIAQGDRVVDREEIIKVVWKDTASTAGVTDQAVDQLIFRLRKKIEENPNNPTHLLTVKGRGFKLVP